MKTLFPIIALLLGGLTLPIRGQANSPQELMASYREAMQEKSVEKLNAITYMVGQSETDEKQVSSVEQMLFDSNPKKIGDISLEPLPPDFQSVYVVNGKKIELTAPAVGIMKIVYQGTGNGPETSAQPYTVVDGHYFLTSSKSTDLGWKGPPDKTLCLMVMSAGPQDKVQIAAKWNASGVDIEHVFNASSTIVLGQYVESAAVTSSNPNATLTILENGKQVFLSQPLRDKKAIEYKRD